MKLDGQRFSSHGKTSYGGDLSRASSASFFTDASTNFGKSSRRSSSRSTSFKLFSHCLSSASSVEEQDTDEIEVSAALSTSTAASNFENKSCHDTNGGEQGNTHFSMQDIIKATNNFSGTNKIGEGHFGTIYKGRIRDGSFVAVKRKKKDAHDKHASIEFKNEIKTLSEIEHFNLVGFRGYLEHADERIIVVEYVGNGNLRSHLNEHPHFQANFYGCCGRPLDRELGDQGSRGRVLEFANRLQIAIDTAHAVTYLHAYGDHPIIHRDIKATNILITENYRAKLADFGFARLVEVDLEATHVITQVKGTAGYLDPEYIKTFELTEKSDVYSFGVVLVELVTGRRPIESNRKERMTITWAMEKHKMGETAMVIDPSLKRSPETIAAVEKILNLARHCLAPSRRQRPPMKKCAEVLWKIRKDFQDLQVLNTSSSTDNKEENSECQFKKDSSDLSSTSSSRTCGVMSVQDVVARDMDTPADRGGMAEPSPSYDNQGDSRAWRRGRCPVL